MALSKTIEINNSGVNATYWVLAEVKFDLLGNATWAKLNGYASSAAFSAGKSSIADRGFTAATPGSFGTTQGSSLVTAVYTFIKTTTEFSGATDVA